MLISKEGYQSGIKDVDGSYKIYNNTTIRKDQIELKNEDVTTNEIEASINCTNNGCTGFIKQLKDGEMKSVSTFSKQARGTMARWIFTENIQTIFSIASFDLDGYRLYSHENDNMVFLREEI